MPVVEGGGAPSPTRQLIDSVTGKAPAPGQTSRPSPRPVAVKPVAKPKAKPKPRVAGTKPKPATPAPAATPGVNPLMDARLRALIAAAPGRVTVTSGARTRAQQQKLYDDYLAGTGNLAAKPGTSLHEKGLALDLGFENDATRRWVHANAANFGLVFPIKSEPWHAEPVEARGAQLAPQAVKAGLRPLNIAASGSAPAASGGGGVPGATGLPDGTPADPAAAIAEYGYIAELANSVPDIKKVLTQAVQEGWEPSRFQAEIQKTGWWQKTTESQRQVEVLKKTQPQEYRRQRQQMIDFMVITARNLGVEEGKQRIFILAERALSLGWSEAEVQRFLAADVKVKETGNTGATAVTVESLKEQAAQYGVPLSDKTMQMWTTQILRGMVPAESFEAYLKEQAKSLFPGLAAAIDSGVNVRQYVDPYVQMYAQTLEKNPNAITLDDPHIQKALYQVGKDGTRTTMSLGDYGQYLRETPDYRKTRTGMELAARAAEMITDTWGATAR